MQDSNLWRSWIVLEDFPLPGEIPKNRVIRKSTATTLLKIDMMLLKMIPAPCWLVIGSRYPASWEAR